MCNFFSRSKQHFRKHPCCCVSLAFLLLLLLWLADLLLVQIITPFRCEMWKGKEVEVFLTPEEWRKLSGVNESLKDSEWVYYPTIEGEPEKDPFFIKNQGLYQPVMYFNGDRHWLSEVNSKYPYLNIYIYIYPKKILGHNTFILYDQNLKKRIVQYNIIRGYFRDPFFGAVGSFDCNKNAMSDGSDLIEDYLK